MVLFIPDLLNDSGWVVLCYLDLLVSAWAKFFLSGMDACKVL